MNFKVGDRVRIRCPGSPLNGKEATVTETVFDRPLVNVSGWGSKVESVIHVVRVDGIGDRIGGQPIGFLPSELEPIIPPKSQQLVRWEDCEFTREGKYRQPVTVGV